MVAQRDDALSREIGLKVFAGKADEAIGLMTGRQFAVWEGGTLDVADHWVNAHLWRGRKALAAGQFAAALADFQAARTIPDNLPSDQGGSARNAEIEYWLGLAWDKTGEPAKAQQCWQQAAAGLPAGPRRRSEGRLSGQQAQVYFQALAKRKLGQGAEAETALRGLVEAAARTLESSDSSEGLRRRQTEGRQEGPGALCARFGPAWLGRKKRGQARIHPSPASGA